MIWVLVLDGRQLRASTRSISLPGQYVMTRSYCCRQRSILWSHAGAAVRFFKLIISRGLWSMSMMNVLPYRYIWNMEPYMMAKSSLDVGIAGIGVCEGFAGKCDGLSILNDAGS